MNELGTQQSNGSISPAAQQNPTSCLTDVDWSVRLADFCCF